MLKGMRVLCAIGFACGSVFSQTPTGEGGGAKKSAAKAAAAGDPVAVIDTTAGKLRCTLFEEQTPITVANFIGLANGSKDWKNPVSGVTKHGVPLYDGTIFHR